MDREGSGVNWYRETYGNVTVFCEREDLLATQQACPEDEKIRELVEAGYDCRRGTEASWPVLYHLSHLRGNLTEWLPIGPEHTVLEFGADTGQLTGGLVKRPAGSSVWRRVCAAAGSWQSGTKAPKIWRFMPEIRGTVWNGF